jgi:hypothetical protein
MHDGAAVHPPSNGAQGDAGAATVLQNVGIVDDKGLNIRYRTFYTQGYGEWKFLSPPPPRTVQKREY